MAIWERGACRGHGCSAPLFLYFALHISSIGCSCIRCFAVTCNRVRRPSSVSRTNTLIEPEEGSVVGTYNLKLVGQKRRWRSGLAIGVWSLLGLAGRCSEQSYGTEDLTSGTCFWVDNVRINCLEVWRKPYMLELLELKYKYGHLKIYVERDLL